MTGRLLSVERNHPDGVALLRFLGDGDTRVFAIPVRKARGLISLVDEQVGGLSPAGEAFPFFGKVSVSVDDLSAPQLAAETSFSAVEAHSIFEEMGDFEDDAPSEGRGRLMKLLSDGIVMLVDVRCEIKNECCSSYEDFARALDVARESCSVFGREVAPVFFDKVRTLRLSESESASTLAASEAVRLSSAAPLVFHPSPPKRRV